MHRGYFALWRKIEDHPFYQEPREFSKPEAWLDILMQAQHNEAPQRVIIGMKVLICHYGECLKSNVTWADRWRWSEAKVRRFLKLLKNMGQIEQKSEGITTRIKIINYDIYDPKQRACDDQVTRTRRACYEQVTTDKNDKNVKNKEYCSEVPPTSEPPAIEIPLIPRDGSFPVTQAQIDEWQGDFPAIDVPQQLRNIRQWNLANSKRRKTKKQF